ncbi:patatin-like protein [Qipengyuania thermophila]|uniref:patatin-like protein n=1 Tax=Qipengyuania thermophila TaxID=2509361 RepID=UPI001F35090E|nr:patatin-like protein [Qipengyuania thermophila]
MALVCYGGISLAVYMHGVTKELWHLARASRDRARHAASPRGTCAVYAEILRLLEERAGLRLRVLPDILTGASAGGINAVFLAQAVYSGQSLEPLTDMWLDVADSERLTDPDARPLWRYGKLWAQPLVWWLMRRPGGAVSASVAPEMRSEVAGKISRLVRGRWFQPPFSGAAFSGFLLDALAAMRANAPENPLLPPGYPLDLLVTATDFHGHHVPIRLHSPAQVEEREHRVPIAFRAVVGASAGGTLADLPALAFAARATASFPGAFPVFRPGELDQVLAGRDIAWPGRAGFLDALLPDGAARADSNTLALIDGSVLINAPFRQAMGRLTGRPAPREVDRRFVYIDPRPDRIGPVQARARASGPNFFSAIFGSLSTIPREQPIRDDLAAIADQSRRAEALLRTLRTLTPQVEQTVDALFGRTLFLDRPTPRRLAAWRRKAQEAAVAQAGFAFRSYALAKADAIARRLAELVTAAAPPPAGADLPQVEDALRAAIEREIGGGVLPADYGGPAGIQFFRVHDLGFRLRRMRMLARRLSREWEPQLALGEEAARAHAEIYRIIAHYEDRATPEVLGQEFPVLAAEVIRDPDAVLRHFAAHRLLPETDAAAEQMFSALLETLSKPLRRRMLLTYLGFPFYDAATFTVMRSDLYWEFDPIRIDRISPEDALSIRAGGTPATLRGIEFYNFGAFFSRAYRENDYLWGRLHGAERMVDLLASTADPPLPADRLRALKQAAFLAILDEEQGRLTADAHLLPTLHAEVAALSAPSADVPDQVPSIALSRSTNPRD